VNLKKEINTTMKKYREFTKNELDWVNKLEKVMQKAPPELFMFAGGGRLFIYSERAMTNSGGVDRNAPSMLISPNCMIDGGDW
jgi:hypothetical protein